MLRTTTSIVGRNDFLSFRAPTPHLVAWPPQRLPGGRRLARRYAVLVEKAWAWRRRFIDAVHDHVIVGRNDFLSFRARHLI